MNTEIVSKNKWFCFYLKNEFFCVKVTENLVYIMSYQTSNHQGKYSLCLWETPGKDPGAGWYPWLQMHYTDSLGPVSQLGIHFS